jgi:Leucine-rich repeat (LRR) protein
MNYLRIASLDIISIIISKLEYYDFLNFIDTYEEYNKIDYTLIALFKYPKYIKELIEYYKVITLPEYKEILSLFEVKGSINQLSNYDITRVRSLTKIIIISNEYLNDNNICIIPKQMALLKNLKSMVILSVEQIKYEKVINSNNVDINKRNIYDKLINYINDNNFKDIPHTGIKVIFPFELIKLENLNSIYITSKLTEIPDTLLFIPNITHLSLGRNLISIIPNWISNLQKLTNLELNQNKIKVIPDELYDLTSLECLLLYNNEITEISENINLLNNLYILLLHNNKIKNIKLELPKLERLSLGGNPINKLYPEIAVSTNLSFLDIKYTNINSLPEELYTLNLRTVGCNNTLINIFRSKFPNIQFSR